MLDPEDQLRAAAPDLEDLAAVRVPPGLGLAASGGLGGEPQTSSAAVARGGIEGPTMGAEAAAARQQHGAGAAAAS